eukprot:2035538-Amphidinium_carterae.1
MYRGHKAALCWGVIKISTLEPRSLESSFRHPRDLEPRIQTRSGGEKVGQVEYPAFPFTHNGHLGTE